eukprot:5227769-Heterocapsa_arctica.AAC.1
MPLTPGDPASLKGILKDELKENSIKDEFKQFAEQQLAASREMHEEFTRLTNEFIKDIDAIVKRRTEFIKEKKDIEFIEEWCDDAATNT